ncbi:MAG: hypothetical protein A2W35_09650 [Chloroflexi bacterium RBG_16_57_11]|nr:MAG: hypothetical protein A2W35_09650 [Chloroflexi bacterium RBG_16_57_11]
MAHFLAALKLQSLVHNALSFVASDGTHVFTVLVERGLVCGQPENGAATATERVHHPSRMTLARL